MNEKGFARHGANTVCFGAKRVWTSVCWGLSDHSMVLSGSSLQRLISGVFLCPLWKSGRHCLCDRAFSGSDHLLGTALLPKYVGQ